MSGLLRVALWTSWETRCGIASYAGELAAGLQAAGVDARVVSVPYTDRDPTTTAERLAALNDADLVHVQHEYTFFGGIAPGASSLAHYLERLRVPHVITAHTVFTAAELLRVAEERRPRQRLAKLLLSRMPGYRRSVEREPFRRARRVIVHTGEARERMRARGIPAERIAVLPAGIPAGREASAEELEAFRRRHEIPPGRLAAIFGYVTPEKGYETALAALRGLPEGIRLLVAGGARVPREEIHVTRLREEIERHGLGGRIFITGYLEEKELAAAMAAADVVAAPHLAANGSYSVMIALAHGRPVLASDLACFRELAEESGAVELFPAGDERALAERMAFLLASPGARRRLAERATIFAAEHTWEAVARRTRALYEEALAERD